MSKKLPFCMQGAFKNWNEWKMWAHSLRPILIKDNYSNSQEDLLIQGLFCTSSVVSRDASFQKQNKNTRHQTDVWADLKTHPVYMPRLFEGGAVCSLTFIQTFAEELTLISNVRVCIKSVLKCVSVWLVPHPFTSWGARYVGAHF